MPRAVLLKTVAVRSEVATSVAARPQPRKLPQQARSVATVEAIYDATIQVLLKLGADRLTTVNVAERAGVSVGTLYQYFPNKQALLFAVLERHLSRTAQAVEEVCAAHHGEALETMIEALVTRFIEAKLTDRDTSVALYRVAAESGGTMVIQGTRKRFERAMIAMLETANLPASADIHFMVHMVYLTMAGALRGHLESDAPTRLTAKLREHLTKLTIAYCRAM